MEKRRAILARVAPTQFVVEHAEYLDARGIVGWLPVYDSVERAYADANGDETLVIELDDCEESY